VHRALRGREAEAELGERTFADAYKVAALDAANRLDEPGDERASAVA
jgi:hypothetical protein